ncbi:PrgI family protein [Candidatus Saccharibacteria bacterium]|nr:PrgI family protein [Candidatus Saccharibacteria bacterium]
MAQYKVPLDIEAEDKILGPLSLRQFIYVIIGLLWAGLMWLLFSKIIVLMIVLIIPITGFFLLLGFGRRQEQSFESYFVAVLQYFVVPRVRVWDKDLTQVELVKKVDIAPEVIPLKNINMGSLKQLALVMDTHGAQKDPTIQLVDSTNQAAAYGQRIVDPAALAGSAITSSGLILTQQDDVLDATSARSTQVNGLLENVEAGIQHNAMNSMQKGLASKAKSSAPMQNNSHPSTSGAIIKKAMLQSNNLTVEQIARTANQNVISEGQSVKIAPATQ